MERNCSQSCPASRAAPRVHSEARATSRIEVVLFRKAKGAEQNEEIGFILAAEKILALVAHLFSFGAAEQIAALGERRDERDPAHAALFLRREQHARIARVDREGEHAPA